MQTLAAPIGGREQRRHDLRKIGKPRSPERVGGQATDAGIDAPVSPLCCELLLTQRAWPGNQLTIDVAAPAPLTATMLHRMNVFLDPEVAEQAVNSSVPGELAINVGATFPHAYRREMRWLKRGHLPLVHGEIRHSIEPDTTARPRLERRPFDALIKILRLANRQQVHKPRRASRTTYVDAHQGITVGNESFGIRKLIVLVLVARQLQ